MEGHKQKLALACVENGALIIDRHYLETGEPKLTLKDGRRALYFLNLGKFCDGKTGTVLGGAFAYRLAEREGDFDVVYGPAYKGITIATYIVGELWNQHNVNKGWAYMRKEAKDHGEKGAFIGTDLAGRRAWMVDDVITSAKTKLDELANIRGLAALKKTEIPVIEVTVAVDREQKALIEEGGEKKQLDVSAADFFTDKTGIPVGKIVGATEMFTYLYDEKVEDTSGIVVVDGRFMKALEEYQKESGTVQLAA